MTVYERLQEAHQLRHNGQTDAAFDRLIGAIMQLDREVLEVTKKAQELDHRTAKLVVLGGS